MGKITIKEAGRYANFLQDIIIKISCIPYSNINSKLQDVKEIHKKSKANPDAEDEIIYQEEKDRYDITPEELTEKLKELIDEKLNLAIAISNAKAKNLIKIDNREIDIDSAIEYSKLLRSASSDYFPPFLNREEGKSIREARAYAFNIEGNQVPYIYEVEKHVELKYNPEDIKEEEKKVLLLADEVSTKVDKIMSSDIVDFKPTYSYLDSVKDIIGK